MKSIILSLAMVVLLLPMTAANSSGHISVPPKHGPEHSFLSQKETQVGAYAVYLPKGYSEVAPPPEIIAERKRGFNHHLYINKHSDGTASVLVLSIATPPKDITGTLSLDSVLTGTLAETKHRFQDFTAGAVQKGQINSLIVEGVQFEGLASGRAGTRMASGFFYVAKDGRNVINIQAEDTAPYDKLSIPVLQAAALTFRRQSLK